MQEPPKEARYLWEVRRLQKQTATELFSIPWTAMKIKAYPLYPQWILIRMLTHETDLKTGGSIKAGDPVYTLITDERWSLLIPLSEKQEAKLADRTAVRVKFLKDDKTQNGDFSIIEIDGQKYGQIDFNKGLIRYASDRFVEIELVTNTVTGLKIPLSSIVTKEFYTIPSKYATTDKETQQTGFMVEGTDKNGNNTSALLRLIFMHRSRTKIEKQKKERNRTTSIM